MGLAMATNLQKHLSQTPSSAQLQYHNRTMSRGEPLQQLGASPSQSIRDLIAITDIVFLSLSDDAALSSTIDALLVNDTAEYLQGKIIVDTSTVHPNSSVLARDRLAAAGATFLATPVFGASPVAAEGKILWILAGPEFAIQAISPYIVGVMGRGVINLGEDVKQASLLKTAGQVATGARERRLRQ